MTAGSVLVTGGTGYIGCFTALALLESDYDVIIADSQYNSSQECLNRIEAICGKRPKFYRVDITDEESLDRIFTEHPDINNVVHFAALKAVGESAEIPLEYWRVNVGGTMCLLRTMTRHSVTNIVFSSSATVYGNVSQQPDMMLIPEHCPMAPTNPYGRTKQAAELLIGDHINAQRKGESGKVWNAAILRYFNPAGAHPSGLMGEDPQGAASTLLPLLAQVAMGKRKEILVYGNDYETKDGTAIRDYVHILDLAQGHVKALRHLHEQQPGVRSWNLGTGQGSTVQDMIKAFSQAVGRPLPHRVVERRAGDALNLTACASRANKELDWEPRLTLEDTCEDLWRWTNNNPEGYRQKAPRELMDKALASRSERCS